MHLQHSCILFVLYVCMYVCVCVCICKNISRYTDIYRQYIHIHTIYSIHTIHADTYRYTPYTQYKQYIHIHAIQVYTCNTYNTNVFIQYTQIHTIHTHTYRCMYVHVYVCICMYYFPRSRLPASVEFINKASMCACITCIVYLYTRMSMYMVVSACICVYLLEYASMCLYLYVCACFFFLVCPRRKREKVAQARTWCPAMCCQKGNQMSTKRLR